MDKQSKRLIEQLQNIQLRQRKVIQQLQAENMRILSDLAAVRQERDAFREKAALARKENVELQNKLEKASMEYQDLKRGRAAHPVTSAADTRRRSAVPSSKILNMLPVVNEGPSESSPTADTATTITNIEKTVRPRPQPNLYKDLPNPLLMKSPRLDSRVFAVASQPPMTRGTF